MANLLSTTVNGQLNTGNVIDLGYTVNGSIATTAFRGINFHSFSDGNYLIGKRAGAWTQPLDITFYTGIKYHAHRAYGGHKFYTGGFDSDFAFSIGDGDNLVRVADRIIVNGTMNVNYDQVWTSSGNLHLQYSSSGNIDMNYGGGYTFSRTSLRAPIFYDYNDTNYYVDPNSNSYLSTLRVADASSGVSLHVGVGSAHGVYTADNNRKYLVVSGDYYPHMAIVARYANNTNHGAVFSFVGTEGDTARQWNLGISNQNPFLFSIGYNRTGDNNPHYGVGDGWSADDNNHARLSIDRDGNTKIRGMLYVNGTSGGISTGNAVIHTGGGQTIGGITYFSNGESLSLYGIRGRFTNEYIHLYNKVGIGHPSGWGQGEGNTPAYGLSTYGGMNIAYGTGASSTINGYLRINKDWAGGDYSAEQFTIRGTYPSIALRSTNSNSKWLIHNADRLQFYYGGTVDDNNWANKFEIATNGNIWMEWGGWLSDLLNAKQNASTAITTSNIGSQSVNYAATAGSASVATSAGSVDGLTINNSGAPINPDNVTQNQIGYNTNVDLFGQSDGGLYSSAYSSSWIHQIYGDFRSGQIAIRGKNANTWQGWRIVLDDKNIASYAVPYGNMTSSTGLNDNKLYLRTNGDNNHYLWNAADDWEELVYYTGTGFRVKGSTGTVSATFTDSGISIGTSSTLIRSFDAQGYLRIYGSSTNYLAIGPYNNNGWIYFENSGNANGIYFNSPGRYAFDSVDVTPYTDNENSLGNGSYRWANVYTGGWFRNYGAQGIYNESYGTHFYSSGGATWNITGSGGVVELTFRSNHQSTIRGYVYADTANTIGFLNNGGSWSLRTDSSRNTVLYGNLTVGQDVGYSSIYMYDSDEGTREIHCNSNRIGFLNQSSSWGSWCNDDGSWASGAAMYSPIYYDSNDTTYFLDPNADFAMRVYGEICNSNYAEGKMQPGALNIGRTDTNYAWDGGSWPGDVRLGLLANTSETWEFGIHDSGDSVMSVVHFDGGSTLTMGRNLGWGQCVVNAPAGYVSNGNAWGTANSAFFPNGITTAGGTNWIYGFTYIGNAPGNGAGHEFTTSGTQYSTGSITTPLFLVNNHSDNTKGYRIHNTSGSSVSAMFVNSSNQLVIAAGAVDQVNLNKKVYVNGVALGVNVAPSATAGRIDASNDIVAYSSSDERLKYNIAPIENALDKVKSLTGVEFDWKPEYKHAHGYEGHDTGIIAQQVEAVMPSAVRTNDTGFLAVRYEKLIGLLIEGMKEQQAQIDELKAKLDGLTK